MTKQTVAVLFGGQSSEHDVSCWSAATIVENIDLKIYDILLIGITKEGRWVKTDSLDALRSGQWQNGKVQAILSPDATQKGVLLLDNGKVTLIHVDVVFPVLHGLYGEDGTVQGIMELAHLPYVGCGVLASAISMDKLYTKIIVEQLGIRQARYVSANRSELSDPDGMAAITARVEHAFPYPVFVKPSCAGSSCGVSRAVNRKQLETALNLAAEYDRKILVEEAITGREIECAVLGGTEIKASGLGEILAGADFYDYQAKYESRQSKTIVDPVLPGDLTQQVREAAVEIFKAVDGFGLARVDFFVTEDGAVIFNEINTLPGFTSISMYPMLWEARGLSAFQLVNRLIQLALHRP